MRVALLTNIVSPHQLPLANELVGHLGVDSFRYIAMEEEHCDRKKLGWQIGELPSWVISAARPADCEEVHRWCSEADILLSGVRNFGLFRQRSSRGLKNLYMFERWYKPPLGFLRMGHPPFLSMARELVALQRQRSVVCLPIGIHAAEDLMRLYGFLSGDPRCLLRRPRLGVRVREPLADFCFAETSNERNCSRETLDSLRLWGYFVEPGFRVMHGDLCVRESGSGAPRSAPLAEAGGGQLLLNGDEILKVLWVGRMLDWKRADTLVRAVVSLLKDGVAIQLRLVGYGPEEPKLRDLAGRYLLDDQVRFASSQDYRYIEGCEAATPGIVFSPPVPIQHVRSLMREADVVALTSDGGEGWGAVVNEAMAEGRCVIGTFEAGSSATMIEHGVNGLLYPTGNVSALLDVLQQCDRATIGKCGVRARETLETHWSPASAAKRLLEFVC